MVALSEKGLAAMQATLAEQLFRAEQTLLDLEHRVEMELNRILGDGWTGWAFSRSHGAIDVYDANSDQDTTATVNELYRLGWRTVVLHDHPGEKFLECDCSRKSVQ